MSKLLHMPEVLANTTHATINKWLVAEGDQIVIGQCIAEVETDKAVVEMIAEEDGLISKLIAQEGEEVEVGAPIAQLNGDGQVDLAALTPAAAAEEVAEEVAPATAAPTNTVVETATAANNSQGERIFASPLAKRLAQQNQLNLTELSVISNWLSNKRLLKWLRQLRSIAL